MELQHLQTKTSLSFFNFLGRSRYSLQTTRLALTILQKTLEGPPPTDSNDDDDSEKQQKQERRPHGSEEGHEAFALGSPTSTSATNLDYLHQVITVVCRMEQEVERMDHWISEGTERIRNWLSMG